MLSLRVTHSPRLMEHLSKFEVDGTTVEASLFADGRLTYPGRHDIEQTMLAPEPYTLWHEARVIEGLFESISSAIWKLSALVSSADDLDPTLEVLWRSHSNAEQLKVPPSLDRLVAAMVAVEKLKSSRQPSGDPMGEAAYVMVRGFAAAGFPLSAAAMEELWDGAAPACVGLGLVDIG